MGVKRLGNPDVRLRPTLAAAKSGPGVPYDNACMASQERMTVQTPAQDWQQDIRQGVDPFTSPSFSLGNRLRRVAWGVVCTLLFRPSPRPLRGWRTFLLRCFGAKIGRGSLVYSDLKVWAPWNLELGEYTWIGEGVTCYSMAPIRLGDRAVVSQGSHLCTGTHDYTDPNFQLMAFPITIGARAWLCADTFVAPGVTIGEGAVIGARSVVTKDMPAWMVCAGNPCRPLKPRQMKENASTSAPG
ncbi:MAG: hypothetical protein OHK0012_12550 [Synechococcales cyanobacterium]